MANSCLAGWNDSLKWGICVRPGMEPDKEDLYMSFSEKKQDDLESILSYGASLEVQASKRTFEQLCSLAAYAKTGGSRLTVTGASGLSQVALCEIAAYGRGHVTFKD
jgi:hypothetical protein